MSGPVVDPVDLAGLLGLHPPTAEQAAVIAGPVEPTLVVAGAGAGKTETMASRVVWLVANGLVDPARVLGLTFTRKAAQQLSRRIRDRLATLAASPLGTGPGAVPGLAESIRTADPQISTYHAYAGALVGAYGLLVPVEPDSRLLSPTETYRVAHDVVSAWEGPLTTTSGAAQVTAQVLQLAGQLSEHLVDTDRLRADADLVGTLVATLPPGPRQRAEPVAWLRGVAETQSLRVELADLVDAVQARMRAESLIDHAGQMSVAARIARDHPTVGAAERRAFRVVLLDEYQDTGHSQRILLSALLGAGAADTPAVTAVGDPMQSIYGWRGASATNLDRFRTDFPLPDGAPAPVLSLSTSWRNPGRVLAVANRVTEPLRAAAGAVPVPVLRPRTGAGEGDVRVALFDTVEQERRWLAAAMAGRCREIAEQGREPTAAVLVRRNGDSEPLARALRDEGMEVEIVGVGGLLDVPEVADVLALLTVAVRPARGDALLRLVAGSRLRIGAADLRALGRRARELSPTGPRDRTGLLADGDELARALDAVAAGEDTDVAGLSDALADPGPRGRYSTEGYERLTRLAAAVAELRRHLDAPCARLVAAAEQALGLDVEVRVRAGRGRGEGREHLDALHAEAAAFGTGVTATVGAFLDHLDLARSVDRGLARGQTPPRPGRVQILTVHAAKGLEWQVVAVPHVASTLFPSERPVQTSLRTAAQLPETLRGDRATAERPGGAPVPALDTVVDRKQLEATLRDHIARVERRSRDEDRRLFYVAVTRAEEVLLVSGHHWAQTSRVRGPSEFLELTAEAAEVEHWASEPSAENPLRAEVVEAVWPDQVVEVDDATARMRGLAVAVSAARASGDDPGAGAPADDAATPRTRRWEREVAALLEERREAAAGRVPPELPTRLTAGEMVAAAADPRAFAERLRRPVPLRPDTFARRGTRFHTWVEHRFGATHLLELDDLPGAGDDQLTDAELHRLQEAFEASAWALRTPLEVEVPFEVRLGRHLLRGRMDAVFADGDDWVVVDWKTGAFPAAARRPALAIQLAVYRYAWSRMLTARTGEEIGPERVRAVFHYVGRDHTFAPPDLPDARGLLELLDRVAREPAR